MESRIGSLERRVARQDGLRLSDLATPALGDRLAVRRRLPFLNPSSQSRRAATRCAEGDDGTVECPAVVVIRG